MANLINYEQEQWKAIIGYEGLYEVSNFGGVRSLDRLKKGKSGCYQPPEGRNS